MIIEPKDIKYFRLFYALMGASFLAATFLNEGLMQLLAFGLALVSFGLASYPKIEFEGVKKE